MDLSSQLPMWVERLPDEEAWILYYGSYDGIEKLAVNEMNRAVQDYLKYVLEVRRAASADDPPRGSAILVGTPASNPFIAWLAEKGVISVPSHPEGYTIACVESPWAAGKRLLVAAGHDPKGTLNAAHASIARSLAVSPLSGGTGQAFADSVLNNLRPFNISEKPAMGLRGIWVWGDVIHDYRRFIDNMARLRMNYLLIWNNVPPVNCADLISYAHSLGVKVVLGFSWGWGVKDFDLAAKDDREQLRDWIVRIYVEHYHPLGMDGIYFQTPTEYLESTIGGRTTASLVCDLVNNTVRALSEKASNLAIWAGLHATSIGPHYVDFKALDDRVSIMWEDAGALPFSYIPTLDLSEEPTMAGYSPPGIQTFEETLNYAKQLATFRPGTEFALVPKGITTVLPTSIGWGGSASYICGERSPASIRRGLEAIREELDYFNHKWVKLYPHAVRFYREVLDCDPAGMTAAGLINDVMFEARIQFSEALFAETVWDPYREPEEILQLAMSPHYTGHMAGP